MVSICVMWCCWSAFCSLSSIAHATPAAIEQWEIIVLAFDVSTDISPNASLQTLRHALTLSTCGLGLIWAALQYLFKNFKSWGNVIGTFCDFDKFMVNQTLNPNCICPNFYTLLWTEVVHVYCIAVFGYGLKRLLIIAFLGRGDKEAYSPCSEIPEGHHWCVTGWDHGQEEPEARGPQGPEGTGHQVKCFTTVADLSESGSILLL